MSPDGFEPTTLRLKVRCSTTELRAQECMTIKFMLLAVNQAAATADQTVFWTKLVAWRLSHLNRGGLTTFFVRAWGCYRRAGVHSIWATATQICVAPADRHASCSHRTYNARSGENLIYKCPSSRPPCGTVWLMLSSPRRPAITIRILSSAEKCRRGARLMSRTASSAASQSVSFAQPAPKGA